MLFEDPNELSFTEIAEAYIALRRDGKSISIEQFADAVPAYRDEILSRLPVMVLLSDALSEDQKAERESGSVLARDTMISGCRVEEEIGRGAAAVVFRAYQPDFDRKVAIKVMSNRCGKDWQTRFSIERRAMAKLDHPNIVQPYAYVQYDEFSCLIMKFVDGYSLDKLIKQDCDYQGHIIASRLKSDWDLFAAIAADAADALSHAHNNGIIHRDIKPSNLLVDNDLKLWVTDFGLTKLLDEQLSLSRTGDAIGTPRFMAPEQLQGTCDERSDIFSLGLTLYALAAGSAGHIDVSFDDNRASDRVITELRKLNAEVPPELAKVIMKACRLDPGERYQSAEELRVVFKRYLAGRVPDRRSLARNQRRFYIRNFRRKVAYVCVTGLASVVCWVGIQSIDQAKLDETAATVPSTKIINNNTFIDGLVDSDPDTIDVIVKDVVRQHIDASANSINLSVGEANVLHSKVDLLLADQNLSDKSIKDLVHHYQSSALSDAVRLLRLTRVVKRSGLPIDEKNQGVGTVRQLAFMVAKRMMGKAEGEMLEKLLTFDRMMKSSELNSTQFSDKRIRDWLAEVRSRIPQHMSTETISGEIEELFEEFNAEPLDET